MRIPPLIACAALLAALAGCAPAPPPLVLPPTPTQSPLFASEEEALAAAVEVYAAYLAAADSVARGGWSDPGATAEFTTEAFQAEVVESAAQLESSGRRQSGEKRFDSVALQRYSEQGQGRVELVAYLCLDISETRILGPEGDDVSQSSRIERLPTVVTFSLSDLGGRVDGEEPWDGANFC